MPNNIFGNVGGDGLTNPLTEDLLADDFNALDFNEVHLNELHNNSGTGNIVIHEQLNMTNHRITNMADPVAGKDAVTLNYYESNMPSPPSVEIPYDLYVAVSDETTPLTSGYQPVTFQSPNTFNMNIFKAFLTTAPTNNIDISLYVNGFTLIATATIIAGDVASNNVPITGQLTFGEVLNVSTSNSDATATGLKIVVLGQY